MKLALRIFAVLAMIAALAIAAMAFFISVQPDTQHIERSVVVPVSPEDVWPQVSDLKQFYLWSPWSELDPNQEVTFSDPSTGVGATYTWKSQVVGAGSMTYTALQPPERATVDLHFTEPMDNKAVVTFTLLPVEAGTKVTWSMDSDMPFASKAFAVFVDMDAMLGADFQKGLDTLKQALIAGKEAHEQLLRQREFPAPADLVPGEATADPIE